MAPPRLWGHSLLCDEATPPSSSSQPITELRRIAWVPHSGKKEPVRTLYWLTFAQGCLPYRSFLGWHRSLRCFHSTPLTLPFPQVRPPACSASSASFSSPTLLSLTSISPNKIFGIFFLEEPDQHRKQNKKENSQFSRNFCIYHHIFSFQLVNKLHKWETGVPTI